MSELAQYDKIAASIEKAEIQERPLIDDKLAVIQKIAKKIGADLGMQNKIAIARIDNMRKLGDQLDEARAGGLIARGAPYDKSIKSLLGGDLKSNSKLIEYADELNDWPEEEYEKWKKSHYKKS